MPLQPGGNLLWSCARDHIELNRSGRLRKRHLSDSGSLQRKAELILKLLWPSIPIAGHGIDNSTRRNGSAQRRKQGDRQAKR